MPEDRPGPDGPPIPKQDPSRDGRQALTAEILEQLRAEPGAWHLLKVRRGHRTNVYKDEPGVEITQRYRRRSGRRVTEVYGRWVGER